MDKATSIIREAVALNAEAFAMELHRQRVESERDSESSGNPMARRAARAHTLAQMTRMTTATQLAGNMGTMILALGIAAKVLDLSPAEQCEAASDWQESLAA